MPISSSQARRLGVVLLLGAVAGAGISAYARNRATLNRPRRLIDWEKARQVAYRVARSEQEPLADRVQRQEQYMAMALRSEPLITQYMGRALPGGLRNVQVVDRRGWLDANMVSFERVFQPIEAIYQEQGMRGVLACLLGEANSAFLGAQIGLLLGFLSKRVLGQYDLSLLSPDPATRGVLYFVEPNIARQIEKLDVNGDEFRLWITLHEATHVFEFEAFPWVRERFNSLVQTYFDQMQSQMREMSGGLGPMLGRMAQNAGQRGHWFELMLTNDQRSLFSEIQALMSLVEGYSNHVMNAIGRDLLPTFVHIEHQMEQRRLNRSVLDQLLFRVTGMDLKMVQYEQGEAFFNAVVDKRGIEVANKVWESPENLPTLDEIRQPEQWLARMGF